MICVARADGQMIGKFSEEEFWAKISAGDISPDDQYLGAGATQWTRASQFPRATFPRPDQNDEFLAPTPGSKLCTNCCYVGRRIEITKGSFGVELALWLLFLAPGIIYSIWRLTSRYMACPKCKAPNMIPADSPVAREILARG